MLQNSKIFFVSLILFSVSLLRFTSTECVDAKQTVSLADYISRMKEGQDTIYYITSES